MSTTVEQCNRRHEDWQKRQDEQIIQNTKAIRELEKFEVRVTIFMAAIVFVASLVTTLVAKRLIGG